MNAISFDFLVNSSLFSTIHSYWDTIDNYFSEKVTSLRERNPDNILLLFDTLPESLYFDDFQLNLLNTLLVILLINLVLIVVAWKVYGKRICDRFMKPATNKAIEELKASVSKLKLPKEHSPRI